jgi:hypothetical protein
LDIFLLQCLAAKLPDPAALVPLLIERFELCELFRAAESPKEPGRFEATLLQQMQMAEEMFRLLLTVLTARDLAAPFDRMQRARHFFLHCLATGPRTHSQLQGWIRAAPLLPSGEPLSPHETDEVLHAIAVRTGAQGEYNLRPECWSEVDLNSICIRTRREQQVAEDNVFEHVKRMPETFATKRTGWGPAASVPWVAPTEGPQMRPCFARGLQACARSPTLLAAVRSMLKHIVRVRTAEESGNSAATFVPSTLLTRQCVHLVMIAMTAQLAQCASFFEEPAGRATSACTEDMCMVIDSLDQLPTALKSFEEDLNQCGESNRPSATTLADELSEEYPRCPHATVMDALCATDTEGESVIELFQAIRGRFKGLESDGGFVAEALDAVLQAAANFPHEGCRRVLDESASQESICEVAAKKKEAEERRRRARERQEAMLKQMQQQQQAACKMMMMSDEDCELDDDGCPDAGTSCSDGPRPDPLRAVEQQPCALCHLEMSPCAVRWEFLERSSETWVTLPERATRDLDAALERRCAGGPDCPVSILIGSEEFLADPHPAPERRRMRGPLDHNPARAAAPSPDTAIRRVEEEVVAAGFAMPSVLPLPSPRVPACSDRQPVVVRLCGHVFHGSCLLNYHTSLVERRDQIVHGASFEAENAIVLGRGECVCPICRRVSNIALPIHLDPAAAQVLRLDPWREERLSLVFLEWGWAIPGPAPAAGSLHCSGARGRELWEGMERAVHFREGGPGTWGPDAARRADKALRVMADQLAAGEVELHGPPCSAAARGVEGNGGMGPGSEWGLVTSALRHHALRELRGVRAEDVRPGAISAAACWSWFAKQSRSPPEHARMECAERYGATSLRCARNEAEEADVGSPSELCRAGVLLSEQGTCGGVWGSCYKGDGGGGDSKLGAVLLANEAVAFETVLSVDLAMLACALTLFSPQPGAGAAEVAEDARWVDHLVRVLYLAQLCQTLRTLSAAVVSRTRCCEAGASGAAASASARMGGEAPSGGGALVSFILANSPWLCAYGERVVTLQDMENYLAVELGQEPEGLLSMYLARDAHALLRKVKALLHSCAISFSARPPESRPASCADGGADLPAWMLEYRQMCHSLRLPRVCMRQQEFDKFAALWAGAPELLRAWSAWHHVSVQEAAAGACRSQWLRGAAPAWQTGTLLRPPAVFQELILRLHDSGSPSCPPPATADYESWKVAPRATAR